MWSDRNAVNRVDPFLGRAWAGEACTSADTDIHSSWPTGRATVDRLTTGQAGSLQLSSAAHRSWVPSS